MSYDPSHRRLPPRQGGWPQATPPRAWPAYPDDSGYRDADQAPGQDEAPGRGSYWDDASSQQQPAYQGQPAHQRELAYQGQLAYRGQPGYQAQPPYEAQPTYQGQPAYQGQPDYQAETGYQDDFDGSADHQYRGYQRTRVIDPFPAEADGYAYGRGGHDGRNGVTGYYGEPADAFDGGDNGYADAGDGYGGAPEAYADQGNLDRTPDGLAGNRGGFAGPAERRGRDHYAEPRPSGPMLAAPDVGMLPHRWQADRDRRREETRRGLMVSAVTGFLAAAVAIGVTTLAAAFVRPQASPIVAVGKVFVDRTPTSLKNLAVAHFGQHGRTVLLLGMYVIIALLAMALGALTRRAPALGVVGIAAGALIAAFVTITRPQGQPGNAIPWVIGSVAGVVALLWLVRSSAPVGPAQPARGGNRRRSR